MGFIHRFFEQRYPILLAVAAGVAAWLHPIQVPQGYLDDFISSSLTMCVVFLGFMATSMSILISYRSTRLAKELRDNQVMQRLVSYLHEAITWTLLWLLVSFSLYFQQPHWLLTTWAVLATLSLCCYLRVVLLLSMLILK